MKKRDRLSERQIATLKHLGMVCSGGGQVTLTRNQREAMVPLWRRELVEIWYRHIAPEQSRGPYFRPTMSGWHLIGALVNARRDEKREIAA